MGPDYNGKVQHWRCVKKGRASQSKDWHDTPAKRKQRLNKGK
jgi:hypothetical protein